VPVRYLVSERRVIVAARSTHCMHRRSELDCAGASRTAVTLAGGRHSGPFHRPNDAAQLSTGRSLTFSVVVARRASPVAARCCGHCLCVPAG
jgi:hypothetical protein